MKRNNQKLTSSHALVCVLALLMDAAYPFEAHASTLPTTDVTLTGTAKGGVVSLMDLSPIYAGFASVVTTQGESTEAVLNRLADEISRSDAFNWHRRPEILRRLITLTGNTLTLPDSGLRLCFTGTDKGFSIPKPVISVSGSYDTQKHQVSLSWINPPETYDAIQVGSLTFPPHTTNCVYACDPANGKWLASGIVTGKRGESLSPPASVVITTNSQEELDTFPFYMGLAPNWSTWADSTDTEFVLCEQGIKSDVDIHVRGDPWDKPLFQIVKTTKAGVQGGVWRRFLGLKPGHSYKIEVRLNTLDMDACTNEWAFSFHAAHDNQDGSGLTIRQMAGLDALPDGSQGLEAGRIAFYHPGETTKGKWVKRSTDKAGPGANIGNITLPDNVTSITVWLRHRGGNSTGVGMDWIRIEDLTNTEYAN